MAKINIRDRNANKPDKKPNWEYRFEAAKVDGKRKHISKSGFRTKKEAEMAGAKALAEYENAGLKFEPVEISVADYLEYWYDQYVKTNLKYNSQQNYRGLIDNHLKPRLGHYRLRALNPSILQEYANDLKKNGFSKSHVVGILSTLSGALDYAIEPLNYIKDNPMRLVRFPKIERKPRERIILSVDEWQTIIDRFPFGNRFHIPLMIGFYTGMRIGEVFALTWDDIDLENKTITVNKQVVQRKIGNETKKAFYFASTKTESSNRVIRFGSTLENALRREKLRQTENEVKYGGFYTIHGITIEQDEKGNDIRRMVPIQKCVDIPMATVKMVCVDENGEYTSTNSFKYASRIIHHDLKMAFDFHSLRHTHATLLIENGANIKNVQHRLGHEKIETTLQTYVHDTEVMAERSVEIFEELTTKRA
ncbi:MAG: site-specific integrase [Bacteroidales bacterium]|nr:site-specific integrase [Bacteroidales bacterium]